MDGWELISLNENGLELQLDFPSPLKVSTEDDPDLLLVQLDMSQFKDQNGNSLPDSLVKYVPIPA